MVLSNDRVKNEELELALLYSKEYELQKDSISCPCYVCLIVFCASKLSYKILTKIKWKFKVIDLLEANHDKIKFSIRINNFYLLMNKDTITFKINSFLLNAESEIITSCRNNDKVFRYITPHAKNIIDNAVSITEFYLSLNLYSKNEIWQS